MSAIGKGDWVECVDAYGPSMPEAGYRTGGIYQVSGVGVYDASKGWFWLNCAGCPSPHELMKSCPYPGWDIECFRLIYSPKQFLIETLKQPTPPEKVSVDA